MRKALIAIAAIAFYIVTPITADTAEASEVLPSGSTYTDIEAQIDSYVSEHEATTAAVSVAIYQGKDILFEKAYGYTDIENSVKNDNTAVFEWGSCTKLLVWTSVMQLVEKGKIDLNTDIRAYLPEHFFRKLKYDKPITMLNLMNHNAGWQETVTDLFIKNIEDIKSLGDNLQLIEPDQVHEPGTYVAYSNWGAALAGYIVELVSGQSFDSYVKEHIFEPLDMTNTALRPDLSDNERVADKRSSEKCYTAALEPLGTCRYYLGLYPAGNAVGTLDDFVRFAQAFVPAAGQPSPLFEEKGTLSQMLSPSLYYSDGTTPRNYHGFWADQLGVPVIWHNGGTMGSSSWFAFDPVSGTGMVILTNQSEEALYNCGLLPFVFGKYSAGSINATAPDLSGVYQSSRTVYSGFARPYGLFTILQLSPDENGNYRIPGSASTITAVGGASYLMDMGGLKQFVIFSAKDKSGQNYLQMMDSDYLTIDGKGIIAEMLLLILFIVASVYSLIVLLCSLLRFLRKKKLSGILPKWRITVHACIVLSAALFVYVAGRLFSNTALLKEVQWCIVLLAFLALSPVIYIILIILRWRQPECTGKMKLKLLITALAGLIMTYNIIFWQAYKFW